MATDFVDSGLAEPTLAAHFAGGSRLMRGYRVGERLAQIKIAANTFLVNTIEAEHGLSVIRVDRVFDFPVPGDTFRAEIGQLHCQRLQFSKLFREADGLFGALAFLLTVVGAWAKFLRTHNISILLPS